MLDGLLLGSVQRSSLATTVERYHAAVGQAASYLMGRGIGESEAVGWRLGYVDDPAPGHERFVGCVAIPYLTPAGPVAIKFRRIDGTEPKYDAPGGQALRLFNAQSLATGGDVALVCEGEFDAILGQARLEVPAVGVPGTNWKEHWGRCFGDFDRVVVIGDHDAKEDGSDPGAAHAKKVQSKISGAELVLPPAGKDLTEWILDDGVDAVKEAVGL